MWDIASLTTDTFILTVLAGLACFLLVAVCGAGSPMALLCCPVLSCNAVGLCVAMVWACVLFATADDADVEVRQASPSFFRTLPALSCPRRTPFLKG